MPGTAGILPASDARLQGTGGRKNPQIAQIPQIDDAGRLATEGTEMARGYRLQGTGGNLEPGIWNTCDPRLAPSAGQNTECTAITENTENTESVHAVIAVLISRFSNRGGGALRARY